MEHPLILLAWRRLEPSATWDDLLVRMEDGPSKPAKGNVLSMRISRMMDGFSIISTWHGTKDWSRPSKDQQRRLAKISLAAQGNNTTRGFTPGLIDPSQGEDGGRVPLPKIAVKSCEGRGHTWSSRASGPTPAARKAAEADEESDSDDDLSSLSTITDISDLKSESLDSEYLDAVEPKDQSNSTQDISTQDSEATPVLKSSDTQSSPLSDDGFQDSNYQSSSSSYVQDTQQVEVPRNGFETHHHEQYPGAQAAAVFSYPNYGPNFGMKHQSTSELQSFGCVQRRVNNSVVSSPPYEDYPSQHQNRFLPQHHDRHSYPQGTFYHPYSASATNLQLQQRYRPNLSVQIPDIQQVAPRLDFHPQSYRASPNAQSFSNQPGVPSNYNSPSYNNQPRYAGLPPNIQQSFDGRTFSDPRTYPQGPYYEPRQNYQGSRQNHHVLDSYSYAAFQMDNHQNGHHYPSPY